jgi:xanthine dehydrogenase accessory factor
MGNIYQDILNHLADNQSVSLETVIRGEKGRIEGGLSRRLTTVTPVTDVKGRSFARVTAEETEEGRVVQEPVLPQERLIVLGAGHIALPVCRFGAACGFTVCVVDDRPDFANRTRFPEAAEVICDSFENGIRKLKVTPFDYVVVITRGHRHDADCLRVLLPGVKPAYLGMIGSRRRTKGLLEMLKEEGFDEARLKTVCTPIGLPIGAVTPEEIAVSICAELIAHRAAGRRPDENGVLGQTQTELPVLEFLAEAKCPRAMLTVLSATGSTPAKPGAMMAVDRGGFFVGTVGGGCAEAAAMARARRLIDTGGSAVIRVDLTNEDAAEQGMVCGGTLTLLAADVTV